MQDGKCHMNADTDPLLELILENPDDDTARLVLADILRESEYPDKQARGRFLWAGVTAYSLCKQVETRNPLYMTARTELRDLARAGWPARCLSQLEIGPSPLTVGDWTIRRRIRNRVVVDINYRVGVFTRG